MELLLAGAGAGADVEDDATAEDGAALSLVISAMLGRDVLDNIDKSRVCFVDGLLRAVSHHRARAPSVMFAGSKDDPLAGRGSTAMASM